MNWRPGFWPCQTMQCPQPKQKNLHIGGLRANVPPGRPTVRQPALIEYLAFNCRGAGTLRIIIEHDLVLRIELPLDLVEAIVKLSLLLDG